jgi:peroxiredoxin
VKTRFHCALATAITVAAAFAAPACAGGDAPPQPGAVGAAMPKVELPTVGGPSSAAPQVEGKVVLYEFWATWCTPCHVQVEILKELYPKVRPRGVEFVGVATGEPADLVRGHLAKHPSPYPVLLDQEEKLGTALEVLGLPTLVIVDRAGRIVWRNTSLTDASTLERELAAAGAPAPEPSVPASTP